jgi:hypothetical protein
MHTPGPWETTEDGWIYPANYTKMANPNKYECSLAKVFGVSDRARANAHLVAQAPEMKHWLEQTAHMLYTMEITGQATEGARWLHQHIKETLAKAEGRELPQ